MRLRLASFFAFIVLFTFTVFSKNAFAQELPPRPNPPRLVNDMADMLMPSQADALEQKLNAYNDSTSTQIAVVTMHSTGQYDISDYAVKLGRAWGIGGKKFNNGVLLLIAADDHKAFIATGYGMEGPLPDATCKEIIDNDIIPNFKQQNYYAGIDDATNDMIAAAAGEYQAPPHKREKGGGGIGFFIGLIVLIIIIASIGGGGRGGGRRRGGWVGPMLLGGILGNALGDGGRGGWGGGSGGFGGGGGGFGGFGGGSFGGGGAGGSW